MDKFFPQNKEEKVFQTFEAIAREYNLMNDIISFRCHRKWKNDLVKMISGNNGKGILDVCCGTGDLTIMLAKKNPGIKITGLDYAPGMLQIAEKSKQASGLENIEFIRGNAMELPFPDNSFSHTVISFGLRNLKDYGSALAEMRRVTAPGGLVCCLETSYPESYFIKPFFKLYFKFLMPGFAALRFHHYQEYAWLNQSTEVFLSKSDLAELFRQEGLQEVTYRSYMLGGAALHCGRK